LYNRFYLNPHITPELSGTELNYNFRGQKLKVGLEVTRYSVANNMFKIISNKHFGFYAQGNELFYFDGSNNTTSLKVKSAGNITLDIKKWDDGEMTWKQTTAGIQIKNLVYKLSRLTPNTYYTITSNQKKIKLIKSNAEGAIFYNHRTTTAADYIVITKG
jgi:hypothetical protein